MKHFFVIISCLFIMGVNAQTEAEKEVKNTIERFFEGFHKQDSMLMKTVVYKDIVLQSIKLKRENEPFLITNDFSDFLKSIVSIPKGFVFEEKLLSYTIKIDGDMANVWTEYQFWFDGNFSHCGVNSFQLFKDNGTWKIIYLVDTRRHEGCEN